MIRLKLSNDELWHMLQKHGYTIEIEKQISGMQYVTFNGRFAVSPYTRRKSYSAAFSKMEIIEDSLQSLLKWTGLRPRITLDY